MGLLIQLEIGILLCLLKLYINVASDGSVHVHSYLGLNFGHKDVHDYNTFPSTGE